VSTGVPDKTVIVLPRDSSSSLRCVWMHEQSGGMLLLVSATAESADRDHKLCVAAYEVHEWVLCSTSNAFVAASYLRVRAAPCELWTCTPKVSVSFVSAGMVRE
jgi:hypothetical protein